MDILFDVEVAKRIEETSKGGEGEVELVPHSWRVISLGYREATREVFIDNSQCWKATSIFILL